MAFGRSGGVRFLDLGGCSGSDPFRIDPDAPGGGSGFESSGWLSGGLGGSDSWIWVGALEAVRFVLILMFLEAVSALMGVNQVHVEVCLVNLNLLC